MEDGGDRRRGRGKMSGWGCGFWKKKSELGEEEEEEEEEEREPSLFWVWSNLAFFRLPLAVS